MKKNSPDVDVQKTEVPPFYNKEIDENPEECEGSYSL